MSWYDILGTLGVGVIILAYALLQTERIRSDQLLYSLLNCVGAMLVLVSLIYTFNLPSFIVELFWLLISLYGIAKFLMRK